MVLYDPTLNCILSDQTVGELWLVPSVINLSFSFIFFREKFLPANSYLNIANISTFSLRGSLWNSMKALGLVGWVGTLCGDLNIFLVWCAVSQ